METCEICGGKQRKIFDATVLGKLSVGYFICDSCGFVNTEEPYWLAEAYASALADSDTGILGRAHSHARLVSSLLLLAGARGKVLDFGAGYGLITKALRDIGHDCYWYDRYAENIFARGFEGSVTVDRFDAIVCLEVIEHLRRPRHELRELIEAVKPDTLVVSTLTYDPLLRPDASWWYLGLEHGQHISLFALRTMDELAKKLGYHYASCGTGFHVLTRAKLPSLTRFIVRSSRLASGLHPLLSRTMVSRTHEDHLRLKAATENLAATRKSPEDPIPARSRRGSS